MGQKVFTNSITAGASLLRLLLQLQHQLFPLGGERGMLLPKALEHLGQPLRFRGNEVVLFHVLDPKDVRPDLKGPAILVDMETQQHLEVTPDYTKNEYREKIDAHLTDLRDRTQAAGMGYCLLMTDRPLDAALREYLSLRGGRN